MMRLSDAIHVSELSQMDRLTLKKKHNRTWRVWNSSDKTSSCLLLGSKWASASLHSLTCSCVSTGGGGSASKSNAAPGTGPVEHCASACGRRKPDPARRETALSLSRRLPPPLRELIASAKAGSRRRLEKDAVAETGDWSPWRGGKDNLVVVCAELCPRNLRGSLIWGFQMKNWRIGILGIFHFYIIRIYDSYDWIMLILFQVSLFLL
jgi:hypothetical protein